MRNRLLEMSFIGSALLAVIGAAAVDADPLKGLVMFVIGVGYCSLIAYQNGGI